MKILPFKIPKTSQESFRLQEDHEVHFYDNLHQHPEIQLTLILESDGKVIVGDFIGAFKPGDIFLIGPNLPHVFRNDRKYYEHQREGQAHSLSLFFEWKTFGETFLSMPEMAHLNELAKSSERGLLIQEPIKSRVAQLIKHLFKKTGMDRIIVLLKILSILSSNKSLEPLASSAHDDQLVLPLL
jgi:hypothetical protein